MTSRVAPKRCSLHEAVGKDELCPGASCVFWEGGGSIVPEGCAVERLELPVGHNRALAEHLLGLRLAVEQAATDVEQAEAYRRFTRRLNRFRDES